MEGYLMMLPVLDAWTISLLTMGKILLPITLYSRTVPVCLLELFNLMLVKMMFITT